MKATNETKYAVTTTRILLGLVMLIPGLMKLFVMKPAAVTGMLSGMPLFAWAPGFWAWVLILSEIIFGLAVLVNFKLRLTAIPPMIILVVAAFTAHWANWGNMLTHLALASMYWVYSSYDND
jgi:putative oxidoreductase